MKRLLLVAILMMSLAVSSFAGGGGDILRASFVADKLEYHARDEKTISWDSYAYIGYDIDKIYIYSEGEKTDKALADSENQLVYSRAIAPYWDVQIGVDYDKSDAEDKTWAVVGLQGLAPYFFETRATLLFADDGNIGLRAEIEYEALITQKLILTPSIAIDAYTKDDLKMNIGSGLSNTTIGARLRYEIKREFAPYLGIEWNKNFSNTNTLIPLDETYLTVGFRIWF
jgi:copper resistance protein B